MIKRKLILPLGVMISLFLVFGCGKRLPTDTGEDTSQGYPRTVMVELFTSEYCTNCPKADAAAESLAAEMGDSLCLIEFHPAALPTFGDSLGLAETDQLVTQYWVGMPETGALPLFTSDGGDKLIGASTISEAYQNYRQKIDVRKLQNSPLKIALTAQSDQGKIIYSATITAGATLPANSQLGLVLVAVEDSVNAYGKVNRQVARVLKPGIDGELLTLAQSSTVTKTGNITKDAGWVPGRVSVIAYVRNIATREILQSAKARVVEATVPPVMPTLSSPADDSVGVSLSPTLVWNPANGAASYTLHVSDDSLFSHLVQYPNGLTGTSLTISGLANSTTYYWRVNASNNAGISAWSAVRSFTTTATPLPAAPVQASPYNGANGISRSPTLTWGAVTGAITYDVQVATDNSFAPQAMVAAPSGLTGTSYLVLGLDSSAAYYWRVRVTNAAGISAWSSPSWSFITTNGAPPAIPTLTSPANGELNSGISPSLNWNSSLGATDYTVQVSPYSDFRYLRYNQGGLPATNFTAVGIDSLTTYYWRVSASNASGTSAWSDVWSLTESRGYAFSRIIVPDTLTWAPDTLISFHLHDTSAVPDIPGFHLFFTNLAGGRPTLWNHAPMNLCSDTLLMAGGQLCNTITCGPPGGDIWDNRWDVNNNQHWTVHMTFNVTYPPAGTYNFTLLSWSDDNPGQVMSRKLYIEVLP